MTAPVVLAIDGGNSKTHLALVRADGEVLAVVRGPQSSPQSLGVDRCLVLLDDLLEMALVHAGMSNGARPVADVAQLLLAGVDFLSEEEDVREAARKRRLASTVHVGNDTFAVLRAGTERGWGVAVVCGAGINCVGVAPDGRQARFPALGWTTGDWGGGYDIGAAAVSAAARSEDGRGGRTTLEQAVPAYFGLTTPLELAEAMHRREISDGRVVELAPVVLAEAARDAIAASIVERLAAEVVLLIRVALERLELTAAPVDVVLGGGVMQSGDGRLTGAVEAGLAPFAPSARVHVTRSPPIVGAALLGLDEFGAGEDAQARVRREIHELLGDAERGRDGLGSVHETGRSR